MSEIDELVHRMRPAKTDPVGAIVLFHGRGAHEHDLFPLIDILDPDGLLEGVTPRAPLELPPGGYHWYVTAGLGTPEKLTFLDSYELLGEWLEVFADKTGVPMSRTLLGGFSQGAVMAYAMALGKGRPTPAGLMAFSGFMPSVESFEMDLSQAKGLPVAIGHGILDDVIGAEWGRDAKDALEGAGADVLHRESPMAHGIDPTFLIELKDWLPKTLDRSA